MGIISVSGRGSSLRMAAIKLAGVRFSNGCWPVAIS
jgi:hypothetical protein